MFSPSMPDMVCEVGRYGAATWPAADVQLCVLAKTPLVVYVRLNVLFFAKRNRVGVGQLRWHDRIRPGVLSRWPDGPAVS